MKNIAIILSAGIGKRMNSDIPKQYIEINDKPIIYYTINAFEKSEIIDGIILVCGEDDIEYCRKNIVQKYAFKKIIQITSGGKERYNSVINGLKCISECDNVYIHDGARPFVNEEIIKRVALSLNEHKACVVAVKVKDTIKIIDENKMIKATPDRSSLYQVQTPQAFSFKLIKNAYMQLEEEIKDEDRKKELKITDDAMVVERYSDEGIVVAEGDYNNIKITSPEDMIIGKSILEQMNKAN